MDDFLEGKIEMEIQLLLQSETLRLLTDFCFSVMLIVC